MSSRLACTRYWFASSLGFFTIPSSTRREPSWYSVPTIHRAAPFRRDQIWMVEKDPYQRSEIYPLIDFSPRKVEDLDKGYLIGRYGGIPWFWRNVNRYGPLTMKGKGFRSRTAKDLERKLGSRHAANRILIVCEGQKTEPKLFHRDSPVL